MKVLNFGSMNLDYVYQLDHFVKPGETISAFSQTLKPGGKGLNQSVALSRAGANVYHAGRVGLGGESLKTLLEENGVNTDLLHKTDELQGNAIIQVTPEGENSIILFGGSNQCISEDQIEQTLEFFTAGDYLLLQNEINNNSLIVEKAYHKGMKIVLNPSPFNEKLDDVDFSKLSWLFVNEVEAEQISGSQNPDVTWKYIHEKYPQLSLLVTLGKDGSIVYFQDKKYEQRAFATKAVDTTAAGDTYTGYFLSGLINGETIEACMKKASFASSLSVRKLGAAESIPHKEEVEACLEL